MPSSAELGGRCPAVERPQVAARDASSLARDASAAPRIALCVCTCDRDAGLAALLEALAAQDGLAELASRASLVVVDDSRSAGRAPELCERFARSSGLSVRYVRVQARNVALARNAAIRQAGDAELVVFVDDDELPARDWLARLLERFESSGADIVLGPVLPLYGDDCPAWLRQGGYLDIHPEKIGVAQPGSLFVGGGSGNMLAARRVFETLGEEPFDPRFGRSGGSDSDLFARSRVAGFRIVGAPAALCHTPIPPQRATRRYLLRFAFSGGCNSTRTLLALARRSPEGRRHVLSTLLSALRHPLGRRRLPGIVGLLMRLAKLSGVLYTFTGLPHVKRY